MPWRWLLAAALAVYCLWGALLISQQPGLQYDEALLVAGGVALRHPAGEPPLPRAPHTWMCRLNFCFPLMAEGRYIGAIKEYLSVPLFALFGARAETVRVASMLLALLGLWGIAKFAMEHAGPPLGIAVALTLAMNPAFVNMTVFDNGAVGALMAGLGLSCAALSVYLRQHSTRAALWLGVAAGFGVWSRANFIWILLAASGASIIVLRRSIKVPWRHALALLAGGVGGGFPFLLYQVVSRGGTFQALDMQTFQAQESGLSLLSARLYMLSEVLLSDSEHRVMWGSSVLPDWQRWFFLLVTLTACAVCLLGRRGGKRWPLAQIVALTFVFVAAFLFASNLRISEHHLIVILPVAALAVVLGCAMVTPRFRWIVAGPLAALYLSLALFWHVEAIRGLRATGGINVWSDAIVELTREARSMTGGRELKILDWGFFESLYVLSDGKLVGKELYAPEAPQASSRRRPWLEEIQEGGLFLLSGPENRQFPAPVAEFLRTLDAARPVIDRRRTVLERGGAIYAQLIDVRPYSIGQRAPAEPVTSRLEINMSDPDALSQLTGVYGREANGWRWTGPRFSATLGPAANASWLALDLYIAEASVKRLGRLTLSGSIGSNRLSPETYDQPGEFTYKRRINPDWFATGPATIEFKLDKWLPASAEDSRELGLVLRAIRIYSE
jgi:hypothetical protein